MFKGMKCIIDTRTDNHPVAMSNPQRMMEIQRFKGWKVHANIVSCVTYYLQDINSI